MAWGTGGNSGFVGAGPVVVAVAVALVGETAAVMDAAGKMVVVAEVCPVVVAEETVAVVGETAVE